MVLGNRGKGAFKSGEHGNKCQIFRGTREQRQYWGTGTIRHKFTISGKQGNKPIFFVGIRELVPTPWEGLITGTNFQQIVHFIPSLVKEKT